MSQFLTIQPVLPARNVSEAIDFYVGKMGFELTFQDTEENPHYAGVKRDNIEIHLQWHDEKNFDKVERLQLRFVINSVEKLFEEYKDKDFVGMNDEPIKTSWGTYEFSFFDLNGNALFFYQDI